MSITKPAVLPAWADTAAAGADIVQPTNAFISAGWQLSAVPPSRQYFNWVLNYAANAVRYFSRRGIVDYDAAETYQKNDIVRGDDNTLYQSLTNSNTGNPPSTSTANWTSLNLFPRSPVERALGIVPVDTRWECDNVWRFGAIGDDVNDDTAAIQAALNVVTYAGTVGRGNVNGRVYFPASPAYRTTSTLYFGPSTILEGDGENSSLIDYQGTGVAYACLNPLNTSTQVHVKIRDLSLYCSGGAQIGLLLTGGSFYTLDNVIISGQVKHAAVFNQCEVVDARGTKFSPLMSTSISGLWIVNGPDMSPSLTFTAAPIAGATSGTLNANWTGTTGWYSIQFVETAGGAAEPRLVLLTNGNTAVTWPVPLANACNATTTAANVGFTNRLEFDSCNFNPNSTVANSINDDGGVSHSFLNCNASGGQIWLRAAGVSGLYVTGGELEAALNVQISLEVTTLGGTYVGPCIGGEIGKNTFYGNFAVANLINIVGANGIGIRNNIGGGYNTGMIKFSGLDIAGCTFEANSKPLFGTGRTTAPIFDPSATSTQAYANNAIRQYSQTHVLAAMNTTGSAQVITPASMEGIVNGSKLLCGSSTGANLETVTASSVTGSTFTATFTSTKAAGWTVKGAQT